MENIGSYLSEKRESKGIGLERISSITKIHINILRSIENNDFSQLGGTGYTKILITSYARALGLSQDEINKLLAKTPKGEFKSTQQPKEILHPPTVLIHKNFFLFILLIILIAVLSYTLIRLYRQDKLSFPFRGTIFPERRETPVEPEEGLIPDETGETDSDTLEIEPLSEATEEIGTELLVTVDSSEADVSEETDDHYLLSYPEEMRSVPIFKTDRTDYLTMFSILTELDDRDKHEADFFEKYIRSF